MTEPIQLRSSVAVPTEHHARHPALRDAVMRHAPSDGAHTTAIEGLRLYRFSQPGELSMVLYEPSMCLLAQGGKRVWVGEQAHEASASGSASRLTSTGRCAI